MLSVSEGHCPKFHFYVDSRRYGGCIKFHHRTHHGIHRRLGCCTLPPSHGVHHMPQAYNRSDPSLLPIERPRCPKCQGRMTLAQIEQGPGGADLRTFECPKCEHVQKMLVVEDPLKSANTGWTAGELRPPT